MRDCTRRCNLCFPLWDKRELAIVQGVGYAQPNLSHFRSIEIWETASKSDEYLDEGWLSRVFAGEPAPKNFAADGVVVGSQELGPLAGANTRAIALASTDRFLRQSQLARDKAGRAPNSALAHILKVEADIQQAAQGLKSEFTFRTEFPKSQFGEAVKTAAQVISSRAPVAVVRITLDGFDTHSNQANRHARLLMDLGEGLTALKSALIEINLWDSTLVMTYAEFGRRPRENQSGGTDHGTAGTHFLLGGKVAGGLYGQPPRLGQLDSNGNLPFAVDFRALYATVIEKWWRTPSHAALNGKFATLDVLKA